MNNSNKKNEEKIPIFQIIYCAILCTLIIFRIVLKNVSLYINLTYCATSNKLCENL